MKCPSYNLFFKSVSSKIRVEILELLVKKSMSVTEIAKSLNEEQSKISHNLRKLYDCHFIEVEKAGKKRIYSLTKETILPLMKLVGKHVEKYCTTKCKSLMR